MTTWRNSAVDNPPEDGRVVVLQFIAEVRAYWDVDLKAFVLVRPLHVESIRQPKRWRVHD